MNRKKVSEWVADSRLLAYFFDEERSLFGRIGVFAALFFSLPLVLLAVSAVDRTLVLPGKAVGMLEDYLLLSFAFAATPLLFLLLRLVISKFIYFLADVPSFTSLDADSYARFQQYAYDLVVTIGTRKKFIALKYAVGLMVLASNLNSIIRRADGWNSLAHPAQFSITAVYLAMVLCVVLTHILFKYLLILWAEIQLTRQLARENVIVVRPIAPDNAGGLRNLGELSLAFTYFLLPFTLTGLMHYFTWRQLTLGIVLGLAGFIPLFLVVFILPLGVVHQVMAEAKRESLHSLSEKYLEISRRVIHMIKDGDDAADLVRYKQTMEMLDHMYEKVDKMPVWPFNIKTISRFVSVTLGPLGLIFLEIMIGSLISFVTR